MTGIDEAQARWQQVRAKGRTRLIIVLVVAIVVLAVIALAAQGSAGLVVGAVVAVLVVAAAIYLMVSKQKTGLSLTPEWAPKDRGRDEDDEDDVSGAAPAAPVAPAEPVEPIRKVDAQILGVDLVSLGQPIGDKLQSSYALGDLLIDSGKVAWNPSTISGGQGAQPLESAPGDVAVIERVPLWGSWALLRLERSDASEWCFRIPSSVDLSPALSELGLTLADR